MRSKIAALLVALVLWAAQASAAIALVVSVSKAGSGATANVDTSTTTLLVGACAAQSISAGISDSKSNTWTRVGAIMTNGPFSMESALYYVNGTPTVGSGHNFTCGDSVPATLVMAFSGTTTTSPLDVNSEIANQTSPVKAGSITPTANNEVLVFANGGFWTATPSVDGGFTLQESQVGGGGVNYAGALSYLIQTTATAANPGLTFNLNSAHAHLASFKETGGSPPATVYCRRTLLGVGC